MILDVRPRRKRDIYNFLRTFNASEESLSPYILPKIPHDDYDEYDLTSSIPRSDFLPSPPHRFSFYDLPPIPSSRDSIASAGVSTVPLVPETQRQVLEDLELKPIDNKTPVTDFYQIQLPQSIASSPFSQTFIIRSDPILTQGPAVEHRHSPFSIETPLGLPDLELEQISQTPREDITFNDTECLTPILYDQILLPDDHTSLSESLASFPGKGCYTENLPLSRLSAKTESLPQEPVTKPLYIPSEPAYNDIALPTSPISSIHPVSSTGVLAFPYLPISRPVTPTAVTLPLDFAPTTRSLSISVSSEIPALPQEDHATYSVLSGPVEPSILLTEDQSESPEEGASSNVIQIRGQPPSAIPIPSGTSSVSSGRFFYPSKQQSIPNIDLVTEFSEFVSQCLSATERGLITSEPMRSLTPDEDLPALPTTRSAFSSVDSELQFPQLKSLAIENDLPESRPVTPLSFSDAAEEPFEFPQCPELDFASFQLPLSRPQTPEFVRLPLSTFDQLYDLPISRPLTPTRGSELPVLATRSTDLDSAKSSGRLHSPSPSVSKILRGDEINGRDGEKLFVQPELPQSIASSPKVLVQLRECDLPDDISLYSPVVLSRSRSPVLGVELPVTSSPIRSMPLEAFDVLLDAATFDIPRSLPSSTKSINIRYGQDKDGSFGFPESDGNSIYEGTIRAPATARTQLETELRSVLDQNFTMPISSGPEFRLPSSRRSSLALSMDVDQKNLPLEALPVLPHSRAPSVLSVSTADRREVSPEAGIPTLSTDADFCLQFPDFNIQKAGTRENSETAEFPATDVAVPYAASAELGSAGLPGSARGLTLVAEPIATEAQSTFGLAEDIVLPHSPAGTSHLHFTPGKIDISSYPLPFGSVTGSQSEFEIPSNVEIHKTPSPTADRFALPPDAADSIISFDLVEQPIISYPSLPLSESSIDDKPDLESLKSESAFVQGPLPHSVTSSSKFHLRLDTRLPALSRGVSTYSPWDVNSGPELQAIRAYPADASYLAALPNLPSSAASSVRLGGSDLLTQLCPSLPGTFRDNEEPQTPTEGTVEVLTPILGPETVSLPLSDMESEFSLSAIRPKDAGLHTLPYSRPPTPVSFEKLESSTLRLPEPSEYMLELPMSPRSAPLLVYSGLSAPYDDILPPSYQASPFLLPATLEPIVHTLPQIETRSLESWASSPEVHVVIPPALPASPSLRSFKSCSLEEFANVSLPVSRPVSRAISLRVQDEDVNEVPTLETEEPKSVEPTVLPTLPDSPSSLAISVGYIYSGFESEAGYRLPTSCKSSPFVAPIAIEAPLPRQKAISILELEQEVASEENQHVEVPEYPMLPASPTSIPEATWSQPDRVNFPHLPSSRPVSLRAQSPASILFPEAFHGVPEPAEFSIGHDKNLQIPAASEGGTEYDLAIEVPNFAAIRTLPSSPVLSIGSDIHVSGAVPHVAALPASVASEPLSHKKLLAAPVGNSIEIAIRSNLPASEPVSPQLPCFQLYPQPDLPPSCPPSLVEVPRDAGDVVESEVLRATPHHNFESLGANRIGEAIALPESIPPLSVILDDNRDRLSRNLPSSHPASVYEATSRIDDFQRFDLPRDVKLPYSVASSPASSVVFATRLGGEESLRLPLSRAATERAEEMLPSPTVSPKISKENYNLRDGEGLPQNYAAVELPLSEASWKSIGISPDPLLPVEVASQYTSIGEIQHVPAAVSIHATTALPESPALPPSLVEYDVNLTPPHFIGLPARSVISVAEPIAVEVPLLDNLTEKISHAYQYTLPRSPVSSIFNLGYQSRGHHDIALPNSALTTVSIETTDAIVKINEPDAADTIVPLPASPRAAPSLHTILHASADAELPGSPIDSQYTFEVDTEVAPVKIPEDPQPELAEFQLPRSSTPVALPLSRPSSTVPVSYLGYAEARELPSSRSASKFDVESKTSAASVLEAPRYVIEEDLIDVVLPDSPRSQSIAWTIGGNVAEPAFSLPLSRAMSLSSTTQIQAIETKSPAPLESNVLRNEPLPSLPSTTASTPVAREFAAPWGPNFLPLSHLESPLDSPVITPVASPPRLPVVSVTLPPVPGSPSLSEADHPITLDIPHDKRLPISAIGSPYVTSPVELDSESIISLTDLGETPVIFREPPSFPTSKSLFDEVPLPASPLPASPLPASLPVSSLPASPISASPIKPTFTSDNFFKDFLSPDVEALPRSYPESPFTLPVKSLPSNHEPPLPESYKQRIPLQEVITSYPRSNNEVAPEVFHETSEINVEDFLVQSPVASPTQEPLPRDLDIDEYILDTGSIQTQSEGLGSPRFSHDNSDYGIPQFVGAPSGPELSEHPLSSVHERGPVEQLPASDFEYSYPPLPILRDDDTFSNQTSLDLELAAGIPFAELSRPADRATSRAVQYEITVPEDAVPALSISSPQEAMESFETSSTASEYDPDRWFGYSDLPELPSSPLFEPAAKPERPWNESVYEPPQLQEVQWSAPHRSPLKSPASPPIWSPTEEEGQFVDLVPERQFPEASITVPAPRPSRGVTFALPESESEAEDSEVNIIDELLPPRSPSPRGNLPVSDVGIIDELLPRYEAPSAEKISGTERTTLRTERNIERANSPEAYSPASPLSVGPVPELALQSPVPRRFSPIYEAQPYSSGASSPTTFYGVAPRSPSPIVAERPYSPERTSPPTFYAVAPRSPSPIVTEVDPEISHFTPAPFVNPPESPRSIEEFLEVPLPHERPSPSPSPPPVEQYYDREVLPSFEEYRIDSGTSSRPDTYASATPNEPLVRDRYLSEYAPPLDEGFSETERSPEMPHTIPLDSPTSDFSPTTGHESPHLKLSAEGDSSDDVPPFGLSDDEESLTSDPQTTFEQAPASQPEISLEAPSFQVDFEDEGIESDSYTDSSSDYSDYSDEESEHEVPRPTSPPGSVLGSSKTVRFADTDDIREFDPGYGETSSAESDTMSIPTTAGSSKPRRLREPRYVPEPSTSDIPPAHQTRHVAFDDSEDYQSPSNVPYIPDEFSRGQDEWPPKMPMGSNRDYYQPEMIPEDTPVLGETRELPIVEEAATNPARRASVPAPTRKRTPKAPKIRRRNSAADEGVKVEKVPDQNESKKTSRGSFLPPLFRPSAYPKPEKSGKKIKKQIPTSEPAPASDVLKPEPSEPVQEHAIDVEDILSASPQKPITQSPAEPVAQKPFKGKSPVTKSLKQSPRAASETPIVPEILPKPKEEPKETLSEPLPQVIEDIFPLEPQVIPMPKASSDITSDTRPAEIPVPTRKLSISKPKLASPTLKDVKKPKPPVAETTLREVAPVDLPTPNEAPRLVPPATQPLPRRSSKSEPSVSKAAPMPKSPLVELPSKLTSFFDVFPRMEAPKAKTPATEQTTVPLERDLPSAEDTLKSHVITPEAPTLKSPTVEHSLKNVSFFDVFPAVEIPKAKASSTEPASTFYDTDPVKSQVVAPEVPTPKSPIVERSLKNVSFFDVFPTVEMPKAKAPATELVQAFPEIHPPSTRDIVNPQVIPSEALALKNASFFDIFPSMETPKAKTPTTEPIPPLFESSVVKPQVTAPEPTSREIPITEPGVLKEAAKPRTPVIEAPVLGSLKTITTATPKISKPKESSRPKESSKSKESSNKISSRELPERKASVSREAPEISLAPPAPEKTSRPRAATVDKQIEKIPSALAVAAIVPLARVAKGILDTGAKRDRDTGEDRHTPRLSKKEFPAPRRRRSIDTIDSAREFVEKEERKEAKQAVLRKEPRARRPAARSVSPQRRRPAARSVSPQRRKPIPEPPNPLLINPSFRRQDVIKSRDVTHTESPKSASTPLFPAIAAWFSRNDTQPESSKRVARSPSPANVEKPTPRNVLPSPERKPRGAVATKAPRPRSESPVKRKRIVEPLPEKLPPTKSPKQRSKPRSLSPMKRTRTESLPERQPARAPVNLVEVPPARTIERVFDKQPEQLPEKPSEPLQERRSEKLPQPATFKPRPRARSASPKPRKARSISPRPRKAKFIPEKKPTEIVREEPQKEERPHRRRSESHTKANFLQSAIDIFQRTQERGRKQERDLPATEAPKPVEYIQYAPKKGDVYHVPTTFKPLSPAKVSRTRSESPLRTALLVSLPPTPLLAEKPKTRKLEKEHSPRRVFKEQSPRRVAKEQSPRRLLKEQSPRRLAREPSPRRVMKEQSPRRTARERSPRRVVKERSPIRLVKEPSPSRPVNVPSPREPEKAPATTEAKLSYPSTPEVMASPATLERRPSSIFPQAPEIPAVAVKPETPPKRHRKRERRRKQPIRASPSPRQDSLPQFKVPTAKKVSRPRRRTRLPGFAGSNTLQPRHRAEKPRETTDQLDVPSSRGLLFDEAVPEAKDPRYVPEYIQPSPSFEQSTPDSFLLPEVSPEQRRYEVELERAARFDREQRALDELEQRDEEAAAKERERLYLLYREQVDRYEREQRRLDEMDDKERHDNDIFLYQQYLVQREQDNRYEREIELREKNRKEDMVVAIERKKEAERRKREEYEEERRRQEEDQRREYELALQRAAFLERELRRKEEIRRLVSELQRREAERAEIVEQQRIIEEQRQAEIQRLAEEIQRREVERIAILESKEIADQQRKDEIQRLASEIHKRELDHAILLERIEDKERVKESVRREELEREIIEARELQTALENQRTIDRNVEEESRRRRLEEARILAEMTESIDGSDVESDRDSVEGIDNAPESNRFSYYYDKASLFHVSSYAGSVRSSVSSRHSDLPRSIVQRPSHESLLSIAWAGHRQAESNKRDSLASLVSWSDDGTPTTGQDDFDSDGSESIRAGPNPPETPQIPIQGRHELSERDSESINSDYIQYPTAQEPLLGLGIFTGSIIYDKDGNPIADKVYDKDGNLVEVESEPTVGPIDVREQIEASEQPASPEERRHTPEPEAIEEFFLIPLPASPLASPILVPQYNLWTPHLIPLPISSPVLSATPLDTEPSSICLPALSPRTPADRELPENFPAISYIPEISIPCKPEITAPGSPRTPIDAPLDVELDNALPGPLQEDHVPEAINTPVWEQTIRSRASSPASIYLDHIARDPSQLPSSDAGSEYTAHPRDAEVEETQPQIEDAAHDLPPFPPSSIVPSLDEPITHLLEVPQLVLPTSRAASTDDWEDEMEVGSRPVFDFDDFEECLPDSDSEGYEEIDNMFAPPSIVPRLPESRVSSMYSLYDAYMSAPKTIEVDPLPEDSDDEGSLDIEQLGRGIWDTVCSLPDSQLESVYSVPRSTHTEEPHNFQLPSPRSEGSIESLFVPKVRGSIASLPPTADSSEYQASESIPQPRAFDDTLPPPPTQSLYSEATTIRQPRKAISQAGFDTQLPASRATSEYEDPNSNRENNFLQNLPALYDDNDSLRSLKQSHTPRLAVDVTQIPNSGRTSPYAESLALARSLFGDIPGLPQSDDFSSTSRLPADRGHYVYGLPLSRQSSIFLQEAPEYPTRLEREDTPWLDDNESRPSSSHTIRAASPPHQTDVQLPISRQSSLYLRQTVALPTRQLETREEAPIYLPESRPTTSHTYRHPANNYDGRDLPLSRSSSAYFEGAVIPSFGLPEQLAPECLPESRPTTSHMHYVQDRHQDRDLPLSRASSFYHADEESEQIPLPFSESKAPRDLPDSRPSTSYVLASPPGLDPYPQLPLTRSATPRRTANDDDDEEADPTPRPSPRQVPRTVSSLDLHIGLPLPITQHPSVSSLREKELPVEQSRDLPESLPTSHSSAAPTPLPSQTAVLETPIAAESPEISPLIGPPSNASPSLPEPSTKNALAIVPRAAIEPAKEGKPADSLRVPGTSRNSNSIAPNEIEEPGDTPRHVSVSPLSTQSSFRQRRQPSGSQRSRQHHRISIQEYAQGSLDIATSQNEALAAAGIDVHFDQENGTVEVSWSEERFGEAPTVDISVYYPGDTDGSIDGSDISRPSSVAPSPAFNNYSLEDKPQPVEASTRGDDRDLFFSPELGPTDLPVPAPPVERPINRNLFPAAQPSNRGIGLGIEGLDTPYREKPQVPPKPKVTKSSSLPNRRLPLPALSIPPAAESIYSAVSSARSSTISLSGVSSVSPLEPGVELPPPSPIQQLPPLVRPSPIQATRRPTIRRDTFTEADNKALSLLFSTGASTGASAGTTPTPTQKAPQPLSQYFQKKSNPTTPTPGPSQSRRQTPRSRGSTGRRSINTVQGAYPSPETSPELAPLSKSPDTTKTTPRLRRPSTSTGSAGRGSGRRYTSIGADLRPLKEGVAIIPSGSSSNTTPRPGSPKATPPILTILKKRGTMDTREEFRSNTEGSMSTITSPTPAPRSRNQGPNTRARAASSTSTPNTVTTASTAFRFESPPAPGASRKGKERAAEYDNKEVFEAYGNTTAVPISPERPISVNLRKRQSMQMLDLETRIRSLNEQNSHLSGELARLQHDSNSSQKKMEAVVYKHLQERSALVEALEIRSLAVNERESQIETLKKNLEWYKQEDDNLTQQLRQLRMNNEQLIATEAAQRQQYERKREQLHNLSQQHSDLQEQYTALSSGLNDIINQQVATVTKAKDTEIEKLKQELATAKSNASKLQVKLNAMNRYIDAKDEVFFARSCGHLFNAVQQWCVKFSKFSDTATCVDFDAIRDESVKDLIESVVLDGSDVRAMLRDRVKRREIFMAMTMSLIWELVFCRYMFGLDGDERKKLKSLEEKLNEVGPPAAVHMWRATTLQLLSQRRSFRAALPAATEPVIQEIYRALYGLLPPPTHLQQQVIDSLRTVVNLAVTLSIDMRTQRAEYFMWEAPDNSIGKPVDFVSLRMNNRGNEGLTNEQLEKMGAMVRVVLFPLVTKRGDENGDGYDVETVIAPMQVLVSRRPTSTISASSSKRVKLDQRTSR
ncbi:hypothetical protein TWF730_008077 [Orbilia blumenaviensis]|uniref:Uncharacterized protein n=1 Tax=Orbilia blumenaviensis TaxID=1796055 RepID=A0AAV9VCK9_9PEZI